MAFGRVERLAENIYSWKLGRRSSIGGWTSNSFSYSKNLNKIRLVIAAKKKSESGKLFLCESIQYDLKVFDVLIVLRYNFETKDISAKNIKGLEKTEFNTYFLSEIKIKNLLEVTCMFLKIDLLDRIFKEEGALEYNKDSEGNVDEIEDEKGEDINNNLEKYRGLTILSGDLKNAFLNEEDSDVILKVGDEKYPAHKVIIRNRSSVFRSMFEHDMAEKNLGVVDILDCDPNIFRDFLLYLYTGNLDNISSENVFELYYMSDKYDVMKLKLDCVEYIISNLSIDIISDVIDLAARHSEDDLLKQATVFFVENYSDIIQTVQWQAFKKENSAISNDLIKKYFRSDRRTWNGAS